MLRLLGTAAFIAGALLTLSTDADAKGASGGKHSSSSSYSAPSYKAPSYKAPSYSAPPAYKPPQSYAPHGYSAPKAPAQPKQTKSYAPSSQYSQSTKAPASYGNPTASKASRIEGSAPRAINGSRKAHDGDTFYSGGTRYRVQGIDTPELGAPRSIEARDRLQHLLSSGNVTVQPVAKDKYGRTVAKVKVNGEDVSEILRREGLAK